MQNVTTERISVRVPVDLIEGFGVAAASAGHSFSAEIRVAMEARILAIANEQRPGGRPGAEQSAEVTGDVQDGP